MNTGPRVIPMGGEPPAMDCDDAPWRRNGRAVTEAVGTPKRSPGARAGAVRRRFGMLNAFLDEALPGRTRTEIAAWLLLYRHAKPDGVVSASVADLARRAGCSDRAMGTALKRLRSAGLLERLKRGTLAGGPSIWRILTPAGTGRDRKRASG